MSIMHLVKCQYQPQYRSRSGMLTISNQRQALADIINDSPSLKPLLASAIDGAWIRAKRDAEIETGIDSAGFPQTCPWQAGQIMNDDFWPEIKNG